MHPAGKCEKGTDRCHEDFCSCFDEWSEESKCEKMNKQPSPIAWSIAVLTTLIFILHMFVRCLNARIAEENDINRALL